MDVGRINCWKVQLARWTFVYTNVSGLLRNSHPFYYLGALKKMGCLKLPYYEKDDRPNFLGLWKKSDGSKNCDNYYPFGLAFNSYQRESSVPNKYLYNKGSERQDDLDLGVYQTH